MNQSICTNGLNYQFIANIIVQFMFIKDEYNDELVFTVAKDTDRGMGSGWERFDFNKEAPLDDDDEIEG